MALVKIFPMRVRIQKLRDLLAQYDEAHFEYLIFQQTSDPRTNKEYDLSAFVVGPDGKAHYEIESKDDLFRDLSRDPHKINDKKVAFGNYYMHRHQIVAYTGPGLEEYLLLLAKEYINDPRYASYEKYKVNRAPFNDQDMQSKIVRLNDQDLNPCPPNQPNQG
jgi:hypothetical protein